MGVFGKQSSEIVRVFGVRVHTNVEAVLVLLAAGLVGGSWREGSLVVACVGLATVVHVVGHWVAAVAYGKGIERVVFTRAGGIDFTGAAPGLGESIVRTAAGPMTNAMCAAVSYGTLAMVGSDTAASLGIDALRMFGHCSLFVAALNVLPAIPLDGGLILRSVLAARFDAARARRWASDLGVIVLLAVAVVGVRVGVYALAYFVAAMAYDVWRDRSSSSSSNGE